MIKSRSFGLSTFVFVLFLITLGRARAEALTEVRIRNTTSNLCLEIRDGSAAIGALAQQNSCNEAAHQIFYAVSHTDGSVIFKNKRSGLCLDIRDTTVVSGSTVQQTTCSHAARQNFTPLFRAAGVYSLISQLNATCFHIKSSSTLPGAALLTGRCNLSGAQNFKFEIVNGSLPFVVKMPTDPLRVDAGGPTLPAIRYGVNLSGGESGSLKDANRYGWNYIYPQTKYIDYFAARGFTTIRVPFKILRLQKTFGAALDETELARLDAVVQYARKKGMYVVLDPHDYGKLYVSSVDKSFAIGSKEVPATVLANFWARMARVYSKQPNVIFNIMNEPNLQTPEQWQATAILALNAIRSVGARQLVMIPGTAWTGAGRWVATGNARVWTSFRDIKYAFDVHQYLDDDSSGTRDTCKLDAGARRLAPFINWARTYGHRGFIGEMGWSEKTSCLIEAQDMLTVIFSSKDVFVGWTYWGAAWANNFLTLNPADGDLKNFDPSAGRDREQTTQLLSFF